MKKNILIVTGGSGGHVVPSFSLINHLKNKFYVKIVTDLRGTNFIDKDTHEYDLIDVPNLFIKLYLLPINIFKYFFSIIKSYKYLKKFKIEIVISSGGYMTLPFCIAAFVLKKKLFLFEPNSVLGRSNKFFLKYADKIICYEDNIISFPKKFNSKKALIEPIFRDQLYKLKKNSINNNKKIKKILVIGGSQGASFFDHKITEIILHISKKHNLEIIQQISNKDMIVMIKEKYEKAKIVFNFFKFTDDNAKIYENVDLAITRGGAGTLSELSYLRIPFISIPLPSARDNHQYYNSKNYLKKNCCWLIEQKHFDINKSLNLFSKIFNNYNDYEEKFKNLQQLTEKNTWNNINNRIIEIINEN